MGKVTQISPLVLDGKSDSNQSTSSGCKKWVKRVPTDTMQEWGTRGWWGPWLWPVTSALLRTGGRWGRVTLASPKTGDGCGPWPGTSGPGGRWGQEGQHYCLLQRGQGQEVPRGHTSPVLRPLGLLCVSRAAAPRGAGPHQKSRGGGGTWAETVPTCLNL